MQYGLVNEYADSLGRVKEAPPTFTTKESAHGTKDTPDQPGRHPEHSTLARNSRPSTPAGDRGRGHRPMRRPREACSQAACLNRLAVVHSHEPVFERLSHSRLLSIGEQDAMAAWRPGRAAGEQGGVVPGSLPSGSQTFG